MDESRKEKRAPAALKVKYKSANVDEFIEQAGLNISRGGIFVKTSKPMPLGVPLRLELQLSSGAPVIRGVGKVAWRREPGQSGDQPAGMGIKFIKLDPGARAVVERAVHGRGGGPSRFDKLEGTEAVFVSVPPPAPQPESEERSQAAPVEVAPAAAEPPAPDQQAHVGDFVASALSEGGAPPFRTEQPSSSWADALQKRAQVVVSRAPAPRSSEPSVPPAERASQSGSHPVNGLFGSSSSSGRLMRTEPEGPIGADEIGFGSERTSQSPVQGLFGSSSTSGRMPMPGQDEPFPDPPPPAEEADESPTRIWKSPYSSRPPADVEEDIPVDIEPPDYAADVLGQATEAGPPGPSPYGGEDDRRNAEEAEGFGAALPPKPAPLLTDLASEAEGDEETIARASAAKAQRASWADMETVPEAALPEFTSDLPPPDSSGPDLQTEPTDAEGAPEPTARRRDGATFPSDAPAERGSLGVALASVAVLGLLGAGGYMLYMKGGLQILGIAGPVAEVEQPPAPPAEAEPPAPEIQPAEGETMTFDMAEVEQAESEAEPVPVMTAVTFQSNPPGATVLVDEKLAGRTPFKLSLQVGKPVRVTATSTGFKKVTRELVPTPERAPVRFEMVKLSYVLVVKTDPPGAKVTVENRSVISPEPMDLGQLVKPVTMNLSKPGYQMLAVPVRRGQFVQTDDAFLYETKMKLTPLPGATVEPEPKQRRTTRAPKRRRPAAPKPEASKPEPEAKPAPKPEAKPAPKPEETPAPKPPPAAKPAESKPENIPDNPF